MLSNASFREVADGLGAADDGPGRDRGPPGAITSLTYDVRKMAPQTCVIGLGWKG